MLERIVADLMSRAGPVRFSADAGRALVTNEWPLNIRQLEQNLARAVALAEDGLIHARHLVVSSPRITPLVNQLTERAGERRDADGKPREVDGKPRDADDKPREAELRTLLARHRGNVSEVARSLGCSRMQIHRWMQRYALSADAFRR